MARQLRAEQNLPQGALAGAGAGVFGALALLVFVTVSGMPPGVTVVVPAALVGLAVQYGGRGLGGAFVVVSTALAAGSLMLGHLLAAGVMRGIYSELTLVAALAPSELPLSWGFYLTLLGALDPLYQVAALGAAAYFARRRLNKYQHQALFAERIRTGD